MAAPTPTITGSLDKSAYKGGELMTLSLSTNLTAKHDWQVSDSKANWSQVSGGLQDTTAKFTATAPSADYSGSVSFKVHRIWDNISSGTGSATYSVSVPVTTSKTLFGVSMSDEDHGLSHWDAAHCYNLGDVDTSQRPPITAKAVCLSDSNRWTTGTPNVSGIVSDLKALRQKYPQLIIRYSWGNEVDRKQSGTAYLKNLAVVSKAVRDLNDPLTTIWTSFTGNVFRDSAQINEFDGIGQYVDGIAANNYPPGRQKTPAEPTPYADYVDPVLNKVKQWGVKKYACWETGIPISSKFDRPTYMKGLRDYVVSKFSAAGIQVTEMCYWDQNIGIDNRLYHDAPKTAQAWVS
jgi:hypothetical protein